VTELVDEGGVEAAVSALGMIMVTKSAQRCQSTVGASVDAYVTELVDEGGVEADVAVGGKTVLTGSAQRCPTTIGASVGAKIVAILRQPEGMDFEMTAVAGGGTDGRLEVGPAGSSPGLARGGSGTKRRAVGGAGNEDTPTRLHTQLLMR
jgi:hypothetical protein